MPKEALTKMHLHHWCLSYANEWEVAWQSWPNAYRTLTASLFILVSSVIPAITFASFLNEKTGGEYGVIEVLFSTGLSGMMFSLCAGQPLVIVGVTGPIALFSRSIHQLTSSLGLSFLTFMFWVGLWAGLFHVVIGSLGLCSVVKYVTRFTHETFGALIAVVYVYTALSELVIGFGQNPLSASLLAIILTFGTFLLSEWLTQARFSTLYGVRFRTVLADYSMIIALAILSVIPALLPLDSENIILPTLPVSATFSPSNGRQAWFVDPLLNPTWTIFAAIPAAMLLTILIFFDHNVASMIATESRFALKKPPTYNYDFVVVGLIMMLTSSIGLPPTHGLIPQAPLHTAHLAKIHVATTVDATGQQITRHVYSHVLEQRVSNMLQSSITFSIIFVSPILAVLGRIPISVLGGTFLVLGIQSLHGNTFVERLFVMLFVTDATLRSRAAPNCWPELERKLLLDDSNRMRMLRKIYIFTMAQLAFLVVIFCVMEVAPPYVALTFPIFITAMVAMPFVFTSSFFGALGFSAFELSVLEDNNLNNVEVFSVDVDEQQTTEGQMNDVTQPHQERMELAVIPNQSEN
ncbi:Anion exchange family protein [Fragilaria crotonensis]|nr:Anion exchange family protein [Fragilaria crotonensis]